MAIIDIYINPSSVTNHDSHFALLKAVVSAMLAGVGIEVVGIEVVGIEVVGIGVVGIGVVGIEVVGGYVPVNKLQFPYCSIS